MEVARLADCREWPGDWYGEHSNQVEIEEAHYDEKGSDEATDQYIGKCGGKKGGKGFQGHCYVYGRVRVGHSQRYCYNGKGEGKGFGKNCGRAKGYDRDGEYGKGHGKDGYAGKLFGKGKGGDRKGGVRKACFGCGSASGRGQILFIGNLQNNGTLEGWKMMPMKVTLGVFVKDSSMVPIQRTQIGQAGLAKNRFKVLEVDDAEEETISRYLRDDAEEEGRGGREKQCGVCLRR